MKKRLLTLVLVWCGHLFVASATVLDTNFSESFFASADVYLTAMAWAPDGSNRLFVNRQNGVMEIIKNGVLLPAPFATVSPISFQGESGLFGICFDPNFVNNGYVYVFATVSTNEQQVIRYTAVGDVGTDKTVIVSNLPTLNDAHNGGGLGVGADGKLYWSVGDGLTYNGVNGDLTSLSAKVGRANLDGSVPADNPFVDGPGGHNDYIWALGFRNPFRLTFQPASGALWVDCTGAAYEQIFLVNAGDDTGWNTYDNNQPPGFLSPVISYRSNAPEVRDIAAGSGAVRAGNLITITTTTAHGFHPGANITISGVADNSFNGQVYVATVPSTTVFTALQSGADASSGGGIATALNQGGALTGGSFFNSTGAADGYQQNYFYCDYNSSRIMRASFSPSNTVKTVDYFVSGGNGLIDIITGPDGALYYSGLNSLVYRVGFTNFTSQQIIATPGIVRMIEGGAAIVNVRLAMPPTSNVTVNVTRTAGDSNINVTSGGVLTFSSANWSVPQAVRVEAAEDANTANATATFTLSANGVASQTIAIHALDVSSAVASAPVLGPVVVSNGLVRIGLSGQAGMTYVLEGSTNLLSAWVPLNTNALSAGFTNVFDSTANNFPLRFYRARVLP